MNKYIIILFYSEHLSISKKTNGKIVFNTVDITSKQPVDETQLTILDENNNIIIE